MRTHPRRVVMAPCPNRRQLRPTQARMTLAQLRRFRGRLFFWCPECQDAHSAQAQDLQPGLAAEPTAADPAAPPPLVHVSKPV